MNNKSNICLNFKSKNDMNSDTYWDILDDMLSNNDKIEFFKLIKEESLLDPETDDIFDEDFIISNEKSETFH